MNSLRKTKIISHFLTVCLLLSFWICVENCDAETEKELKTSSLVFQSIQAENSEKDSCSVQSAPSALFSSQEIFALASSVAYSNQSRRIIFRHQFTPVSAVKAEETFVKLPIQILRQLRI